MSKSNLKSMSLLTLTHRVGVLEGVSYLILLGVAMPLKYIMDIPDAVRWTGQIHGILFVTFMAMLMYALQVKVLSGKNVAKAIVLSFIPFGTFFLPFDKSVD
jgi:integral membrane protein